MKDWVIAVVLLTNLEGASGQPSESVVWGKQSFKNLLTTRVAFISPKYENWLFILKAWITISYGKIIHY